MIATYNFFDSLDQFLLRAFFLPILIVVILMIMVVISTDEKDFVDYLSTWMFIFGAAGIAYMSSMMIAAFFIDPDTTFEAKGIFVNLLSFPINIVMLLPMVHLALKDFFMFNKYRYITNVVMTLILSAYMAFML